MAVTKVAIDVAALAALARWNEIPPSDLDITRTLEQERFPGAIVPVRRGDGSAVFYALADTAPVWRRLQPLLLAFAGPTFTDFNGEPSALDPKDPVEQFLAQAGLHAVARVRPGRFSSAVRVTWRALQSLQKAVLRAPDLAAKKTEPTSGLLARLQDALNAGDIEAAWGIHATLRDELRLDAQNLLQLGFHIRAVSGEWAAIRSHPHFEVLCASGPSPATAEILLEALYWTQFSEVAEDGHPQVDEGVKSLCRNLLRHVGENLPPTIDKIAGWAHTAEPTAFSEGEGAVDAAPEAAVAENSLPSRAESIDALGQARTALLSLAAAQGEAHGPAEAKAIEAVERLNEAERQELMTRPVFRAVWAEIEGRLGTLRPPTNWTEWLARLDDENFDPTAYARRAASEWRLPKADVDPALFANLASAIDAAPEGLASERLSQSLPYIVEWATSDPQWPRPALCSVYLALLIRIALSARHGGAMIKSAAVLLESALRCGLSKAEYRDALETVSAIADRTFNRNTAYDVLELADVAMGYPSDDFDALTEAMATVLTATLRLFDRLTAGQRLACMRLARQIGWEQEIPALPENDDALTSALANMTVGVYTLTETAGRNAQAVLASMAPGIKVELNHDHDATAALSAMVARVDLCVVAWASAKHAATNFIKSRRGSKPLVYALGKGASSLIRAIEDYASRQQV